MNNSKDTRGSRYDQIEGLKEVAANILILGCRLLYNFLQKNLPIPNERTIAEKIGESTEKPLEGSLRVEELKKHLDAYNAPYEVWISEDGTGTINKVQYDPFTNLLVGFVIPTDKNSMPKHMFFKATSAKLIEKYFKDFKEKVASLLYLYKAQSNNPKVPPFCLLSFGSDNKMNYIEIQNRWNFIKNQLGSCKIKILGYSSD